MADFTYLPPRPESLSGPAFIQQTELAINEINHTLDSTVTEISHVANDALETAQNALATANSAVETAQDALTLANNAQTDAGEAKTLAQTALDAAQAAQSSAAQALAQAQQAGADADQARSVAENALAAATLAQTSAETALSLAAEALAIASQALGQYTAEDGELDADLCYAQPVKLFLYGETLANFPVEAPFYYELSMSSPIGDEGGGTKYHVRQEVSTLSGAGFTRNGMVETTVDDETSVGWGEWRAAQGIALSDSVTLEDSGTAASSTAVKRAYDRAGEALDAARTAEEKAEEALQASGGGSGNVTHAATADKLSTARRVAISGAVTGSADFDGSADVNLVTGSLDLSKATTGVLPAAHGGTGNANGTAAKLTTARSISLTGAVSGWASFDGGSDVTISTSQTSGSFAPRPQAAAGVGQWVNAGSSKSFTLPAGGTWVYYSVSWLSGDALGPVFRGGIVAGGTVVEVRDVKGVSVSGQYFAWRIA